MISAAQLGSSGGAVRYYDSALMVDGLQKTDNYYVSERALGTWQGKGAALLGLEGRAISKESLVAFLDGKLTNPATGEVQDLAKAAGDKNRRTGWDFTISPSKSVSIVALVGGDERVVDIHAGANQKAMQWLQTHASMVRITRDGETTTELAGNLLYASIQHETNRNNEPQLHSHNVIVAAVYDKAAEKWRSLTNDELLRLRSGADIIYKNELARGLKKAGYALELADNGVDFEIAGLTPQQLEVYSSRSKEIDEALREKGLDPDGATWGQRQVATLDTRDAKVEHPREVLHNIWAQTAQMVGLDAQALVRQAKEAALAAELSADLQQSGDRSISKSGNISLAERSIALDAVSWAVKHLSEREQSFKRSDLELQAVKSADVPIENVQWAIEQHLKNNLLMPRRPDLDGAPRFTTRAAVESEKRLAQTIRQGIGKGSPVLTHSAEFTEHLTAFETRKSEALGVPFKLSGEQINAARNMLMHADVYQGIQGDAGTGKTAVLEFVREVAEAKGWEVRGVATSAAAADELQRASAIPSQTLAAFMVDKEHRIMAATMEIDELQRAILGREAVGKSGDSRVERHRLKAEGVDHDYGTGLYTFDHKRGEVKKSQQNFSNVFGNLLFDLAADYRDKGTDAVAGAKTLGDRLLAQALSKSVSLAGNLGRRLSSFERVTTAEAIAARNALYLKQDAADGGSGPEHRNLQKKKAELNNLRRFGNERGAKTLFVMDEASLTGAMDTEKFARLATEYDARVVLQGDIKQLGSVAAGRAFAQAQTTGINMSTLQETRRFDNATPEVKAALENIKQGFFTEALSRLDAREVGSDEFLKTTADRYLINFRDLTAKGVTNPSIGVVTLTNADRKLINEEIHAQLAAKELISGTAFVKSHLDVERFTEAERVQPRSLVAKKIDTLVFHKGYREIGVKANEALRVAHVDIAGKRVHLINAQGKEVVANLKRQDFFTAARTETRLYSVGDRVETRAIIRNAQIGMAAGTADLKAGAEKTRENIKNGRRGVIAAIDESSTRVHWSDGGVSSLNNDQVKSLDHGYAHTTYKDQGASFDVAIIAIDRGARTFNQLAAYVATSRAKLNTEIVTTSLKDVLNYAAAKVEKTVAMDITEDKLNRLDRALAVMQDADKTLSPGARDVQNATLQEVQGKLQELVPIKTQEKALEKAREKAPVQQNERGMDLGLEF